MTERAAVAKRPQREIFGTTVSVGWAIHEFCLFPSRDAGVTAAAA